MFCQDGWIWITNLSPRTYLKYPISQRPPSFGGTPVVRQNRLSCTCILAGPLDILALGGADDTKTKY